MKTHIQDIIKKDNLRLSRLMKSWDLNRRCLNWELEGLVSWYFAKQHYTIKTFSCSARKLQLEEFGSHSSGAQFYTHSMLCTQYNMIMQWVIVHTLKTGDTPWALSLFKAFLFYVSWGSAKALMAITGPLLLPRCLGSLVGTCQNFSSCGNWNILVPSLFQDLCLGKK